jgi:signal transduction histidine kinase
MGIKLNVNGNIPNDNRLLRFIMSGARESLTNAVHHAKAAELTVSLYYEYSFFVIEYTNDGEKPANPISEGGGLSSLRQSVEGEGGIMETEISPQFILRLKIPSKEVSYV